MAILADAELTPVGRRDSPSLSVVGRLLFAIGFAGLGALAIIHADFALQWQPVPETVPLRTPLAYLNGIMLIACSFALLVPRFRFAGAAVLAAMLLVWVLVLHLPRLSGRWGDIVVWLGVAEAMALFGGALLLFGAFYNGTVLMKDRIAIAGRYCVGVALPVFGLSHFAYAEFTAAMVPVWIPAKLFWAYFTGCAHLAAGLAVLSGIWAPLATRLLALMFGSWVLILHAPRVAADPANRVEWTMLIIAIALTASACLLAARWNGTQILRPFQRSNG